MTWIFLEENRMGKGSLLSFMAGFVIVVVCIGLGLQSGGALAQGDPTPTRSLGDILNRTPQPTEPVATPEIGETPEAVDTSEPSDVQGVVDTELTWWVLSPGFGRRTVENVLVGGRADADLGGDCPPGVFASVLPTTEFHWDTAGPITVMAQAEDGVTPVGVIMWDENTDDGTWWCTIEMGPTANLEFTNLEPGTYPVWVILNGPFTTLVSLSIADS
jgi:hypothetical protein